jgi:hypothetical protein
VPSGRNFYIKTSELWIKAKSFCFLAQKGGYKDNFHKKRNWAYLFEKLSAIFSTKVYNILIASILHFMFIPKCWKCQRLTLFSHPGF